MGMSQGNLALVRLIWHAPKNMDFFKFRTHMNTYKVRDRGTLMEDRTNHHWRINLNSYPLQHQSYVDQLLDCSVVCTELVICYCSNSAHSWSLGGPHKSCVFRMDTHTPPWNAELYHEWVSALGFISVSVCFSKTRRASSISCGLHP